MKKFKKNWHARFFKDMNQLSTQRFIVTKNCYTNQLKIKFRTKMHNIDMQMI